MLRDPSVMMPRRWTTRIAMTAPGFMLALALPTVGTAWAGSEPQVVELTQTHCQFIEPEGGDRHLRAFSFGECRRINGQTGKKRLAEARPLRLTAGEYVFRIRNRDVDYELGFWLRGAGVSRLLLPQVSGGGIMAGQSRDYRISLKPGEYRYSCPLNPTPDYVLIVE